MAAPAEEVIVGVISDTHGILRPEAVRALSGCHHILHAGDVGSKTVLEDLSLLAPVTAVPGNVDTEAWALELPRTREVHLVGWRILLTHDSASVWVALPDVHAVVSGHTHLPRCRLRRSVLDFNPGSAGPRRFRQPVSVGRLHLTEEGIRGELLALDV